MSTIGRLKIAIHEQILWHICRHQHEARVKHLNITRSSGCDVAEAERNHEVISTFNSLVVSQASHGTKREKDGAKIH